MRSFPKFVLSTLAFSAVVALGTGIIVVYGGAYDVAADDPHWALSRWVMETARIRSIKTRAAGITAPGGLDDPAKLAMGVEHFAAHCAVCHGAPGVPRGDIAQGMYPRPPDLSQASKTFSAAELFWILKHGIKMTGMPAWPDHSDDELWATVAFIKKLGAGLSEADYAAMIQANMMHGMQHHMGEMPGMPPPPSPTH